MSQFQLHGFLCLGMMSTTASLGLILLWDVDAGLTQIDKYLYSTEDYIKVWSYVIRISSSINVKHDRLCVTKFRAVTLRRELKI